MLACSLAQAHFGDDAKGRAKAWNFLPWHLDFFCRHVAAHPLPDGDADGSGRAGRALLQTRLDAPRDAMAPLERLLHHSAVNQFA